MIGLGENFVRAMTGAVAPEKIARDLFPMMDAVNHYRVPVQFPTAWSQFPGGALLRAPSLGRRSSGAISSRAHNPEKNGAKSDYLL